jgi:hypothetical protein
VAKFQLARFGYPRGDNPIPFAVFAAAACGTINDAGIWKSARFDSEWDFVELLTDAEDKAVAAAVEAMIKNTLPISEPVAEVGTDQPAENPTA